MWMMMMMREGGPKSAVGIHILNLFVIIIHRRRWVVPHPHSGWNVVMVLLLRWKMSSIDSITSDWPVSEPHGLIVWVVWMMLVDLMNLLIVLVVEVVWMMRNILHPLVDPMLFLHLFLVPWPLWRWKLVRECGMLHFLWFFLRSCFWLFLFPSKNFG